MEAGAGPLESEGLREAIGNLDRATREFTRSIEELSALAATAAGMNGASPDAGVAEPPGSAGEGRVPDRRRRISDLTGTLAQGKMAQPIADADDPLAGLDQRLKELRERIERMHRSLAALDRDSRAVGGIPVGASTEQPVDRPTRVALAPEPGTGADPVDRIAARLLPEHICRSFRILPIAVDGDLTLAAADPDDRIAQNVAYALTGRPLRTVAAAPDEIDAAIDRAFGGSSEFAAPSPAAAPPHQPPLSPIDWAILVVVVLGAAAGVAVAPLETAIGLGTASLVILALSSLYRLRAEYRERGPSGLR